jgi:CheY-like chemotaxis protein
LERAGYRVLEAASGPEAIQTATDHEGVIGLLLTDVIMPGMSGLELAESLSLRRPEIRTLLISGQTGEAALSTSRLPHGFEFLQKPFSLPDLLGRVKSLLDQARQQF